MRDRILRLCKRLDKFTFEDVVSIAEDVKESVLELLLERLVKEEKLAKRSGIYFYNKQSSQHIQRLKLPQFFQHHSKDDINYLIKGFCADVEGLKMMDVFDLSKHETNKFYQYFRIAIYNNQKQELLKYFSTNPKIPQERIYMNTKAYMYLYDDKLFISKSYLKSKAAIKHTNEERLAIKNIYLRSYRKVLSRSFAYKFHLHLAEEVWKYEKPFKQRYTKMCDLLNIL